ncbi:cytochrome b-c1 complex subunit 9 [Calycina marina]|uniref:Complex III subunit 9 n=1 Tax=Calycina marina TaxID=1763456 RepID=A0A9P8CBW2_9HELO|nr:cytochrome b-c1 complex subunit 9 [Calycina marina]
MPAASPIYNFLVRRNYVFLGVIFAGAFGFEMAFDKGSDRIWDSLNKDRQWKDIRAKYVQDADGDDE